jgi:hypothetical protein
VIDESDSHDEKQFAQRISTLFGIKTDSRDENEYAPDSIRINREFDSNVIDETDLQFEKQCDPTISTFLGIKID